MVDEVDTTLRTLAALKGVQGKVRHVVVVIAVYLVGGERLAPLRQDWFMG